MIRVGFELTIPVFERANTVHALDHAATVNGGLYKRASNVASWICEGKENYKYENNSVTHFRRKICLCE
jgi:hypothetical protein